MSNEEEYNKARRDQALYGEAKIKLSEDGAIEHVPIWAGDEGPIEHPFGGEDNPVEGVGTVSKVSTKNKTITVQAEDSPKALSDAEVAEIMKLVKPNFNGKSKKAMWRTKLSGFRDLGAKHARKFWYDKKLVTREEHDALTWEQVHANNNKVTKALK